MSAEIPFADLAFLYAPQIGFAMLLAVGCAVLGVFAQVRQLAVVSLTITQACTAGSAIALAFAWQHDLSAIVLAVAMALPVHFLSRRQNTGAALVIAFVIYAAVAELLVGMFGLPDHVVRSYFGDVLLTAPDLFLLVVITLAALLLLALLFRKAIILWLIDSDEALLSGVRVAWLEFGFFLALSLAIAMAGRVLGGFQTAAQVLIPGYIGLRALRSFRSVLIFAGLFAALATASGFLVSLVSIQTASGTLYISTSSTIILTLGLGLVLDLIWMNGRRRKGSGLREMGAKGGFAASSVRPEGFEPPTS